jgi:hypothetical protein
MKYLLLRMTLLFLFLSFLTGCVGGVIMYPKTEKRGFSPDTKCSEIITHWGEPTIKSVNGNELTLIYKDKDETYNYLGTLLCVGIAIPLFIPVGLQSTIVECKDDVVISESDKKTDSIGGCCGFFCHPFFFIPACNDFKGGH